MWQGYGHGVAVAGDVDARELVPQVRMRHRKLGQNGVAPVAPGAFQQLAAAVKAERAAAAPVVLDGTPRDPAAMEWRRVSVTGEFVGHWPIFLNNRPIDACDSAFNWSSSAAPKAIEWIGISRAYPLSSIRACIQSRLITSDCPSVIATMAGR